MNLEPAAPTGAKAASILLVDDTPANLFALSAVLKPLGARIVEASSGKEALEHIAREFFAVALLDVQMPEMDGFDTADRIRALELGRELPIIFLTAIHRDENFARRGYRLGAADYITKPFDAEIVRARVRAFVSLFEQREEVRRAQVALRTHERDEALRRLVAVERISTAALRSDDVPGFLKELLAVFLSAADAADAATIFLREADGLRARASVGVADESVEELYSVPLVDSFAGRVAAERQPLELEDAANSALVKSAWLKVRGTRGLYGVPLVHGGEVLGVAQIGSRHASTFSAEEKRLFAAMCERAAWAVAEQMKRAQLLELERGARAAAEIASRMKDEFLATVSHELRTPLNAILGWTLTAQKNAPPDVARALAIIERNARAQARLIDDVLDLSRITAGKLRIDVEDVVLDEIVDAAAEAVRAAAEARQITVAIDAAPGIHLRADPHRLQQVVWNLLSNAIKFTPKGGHVRLEASGDDERVSVRVIDDGEGIAPAFLAHVWEPFRQADGATTRRHGGLGLGLAIVKQIVQAHGGTIRAMSEGVGRGATFELDLPCIACVDPASLPPPTLAPEPETDAEAIRLDGTRILVVDDDEDARTLLAHVLIERGASVIEADSAGAGFAQVERAPPDVIVSDIAMPGGDGYGFILAVRSLAPDRGGKTPAIALTAHARTVDGERAFAAGFQAHLAKPVDLAKLIATLKDLVRVSDAS